MPSRMDKGLFKDDSLAPNLVMMMAAQLCDHTTLKYNIHVNFIEAIF